ncbi:bifunctional oligoribonuclease/PAP phosphatase NrnA [Candidatus Microgenomates bacterium]|nr:bifunctional oligoribonuclease/PAP phosphatase NrnA [Candidatus Microgenomates bacterium]
MNFTESKNDTMMRDLTPKQQVVDLIRKSQNILVATHVRPDHDALSSSLALMLFLRKMGKRADLVVPDTLGPEKDFLSGGDQILASLPVSRDIVVKIKSPTGQVGKISYQKDNGGGVSLVISPSDDYLKKEHITVEDSSIAYDLIIALDTPNLERLSLYANNRNIFSQTPVINIDHHATNNYFGAANLVDINSAATAEILVSLFEALDKTLLDGEMATLLLAGILTDTDRFQNTNTTPKSLTVSAQLIAAGARRSEIVKKIFKARPIGVLRAWGDILSNIKEDKEHKIIWSTLPYAKLSEYQIGEGGIGHIVGELMSVAPTVKIAFLLVERSPGLVTVSLRSEEGVDVDKIALSLGGGGHKQAAGCKLENMSLAEAEKIVKDKVIMSLSGQAEKPYQRLPVSPILEQKEEKAHSSDDDLYTPSLSDIDSDKPKIVEDGKSILQKVLKAKEEKKEDRIDFAKLEQEAKQEKKPRIIVNDWDEDEDYE